MADNILLSTNVGTGETLATDDVGGIHYQWIKIAFGTDDSVTKVTTSAGFPVNMVADQNSLVDDAAFSPGSSRVMPVGFEFDDSTPDSVNEGDIGAARMSANRSIYVNIRDNAGNERGLNVDANGAIAITDGTGSITVDNGGTFAVQAAQSGTWNITDISGTVSLPTGASTLAEQQTQTTALQLIDDIVHNGDAALAKYAVVGAVLDDTGTATVTENQAHALRMTSARALHVSVRDAIPAGTNNIGDVDVLTLPALPAGSNNIGDVDVLTLPPLPAGSNNIGDVDVLTLPALPAGSNNIGDVDVASIAAGDNNIGNVDIVTMPGIAGTVAHDDADSGNPVKTGAQARTTLPTAVADADRVNLIADDLGRLIIAPYSPRDLVTQNRISLSDTTETTLLAAVASTFLDVIMLVISHEGTTADVRVDIRDATGGTVRLSVDLAPDGGGAVIPFPVPFKQTTVNNNWTAQLSGSPSSGNVYITAQAVSNN